MEQVKVQGERWFPSETRFSDEAKALWGDWYCDSEIGRLRAVLMRRPGREIEGVTVNNYETFRWKAPMEVDRARKQHDALAQIYRDHGVDVHYVENQRVDRPNALFMRDQVLMTPEGAIVCRNGISARRGEERYAAETLASLGVPIVKTINGDGYFDGACAMWIDRETVIIGTGARANKAGALQVESELRNMGPSTSDDSSHALCVVSTLTGRFRFCSARICRSCSGTELHQSLIARIVGTSSARRSSVASG